MKNITSKQVVFITGAFVGNNSWDGWKNYFESKGFKTLAPAWPHKDGNAAELRARRPNDLALAKLTLKELVDYYEGVVKSLPEKPIIIGHSMGGLITQILVNRGLAAAGVAIHSLQPMGVVPLEFSFFKAGGKALGFFTSADQTFMMSFKGWQYAFTNGMSLEEQKASYEKYCIPESKRVTRGALTSAAKVDFKKPHAPLLFVSGSTDNAIPASLNLRNFKKYPQDGSVTEYKEFPGRNHFVLGQSTWQEDADYIVNWLNS